MAEFTLKIRRFDPESGEPPYWQEFDVDLEPERSVLDGILQAKGETRGTGSRGAAHGLRIIQGRRAQ